jgi:hypothetical protein
MTTLFEEDGVRWAGMTDVAVMMERINRGGLLHGETANGG